jgi:hypothetical protein
MFFLSSGGSPPPWIEPTTNKEYLKTKNPVKTGFFLSSGGRT